MGALNYYTDGATSPNPGQGGWAFILVEDDVIIADKGGYEKYTTNQRMELLAALSACLDASARGALSNPFGEQITIFTDSAYLHNCYKQNWYTKWIMNGWVNSKKEKVANQDLWEKLIPFFECPLITFSKVKGHSDNKYNNIVDELAVSYRMG